MTENPAKPDPRADTAAEKSVAAGIADETAAYDVAMDGDDAEDAAPDQQG